jgi:hypothetical protein
MFVDNITQAQLGTSRAINLAALQNIPLIAFKSFCFHFPVFDRQI